MQDHRINRLEDSLLLWKSVVSNKLLGNVNIILFLNKVRALALLFPSRAAYSASGLV